MDPEVWCFEGFTERRPQVIQYREWGSVAKQIRKHGVTNVRDLFIKMELDWLPSLNGEWKLFCKVS